MFRGILVSLLLGVTAWTQVIHLKNGKQITADSLQETKGKIQYQVGDNTFSIPKSLVDHVEGLAAQPNQPPKCPKTRAETGVGLSQAAHSTGQIPLAPEYLCKQFGPRKTEALNWMGRCTKIAASGGIDAEALIATESECNAALSAAAYYTAANFDHAGHNEEGALDYLRVALRYAPDDTDAVLLMVEVLENLNRYSEEVPYAERAARILGPTALGRLGRAYYLAGNRDQAMRTWRLYAATNPRVDINAYVAGAERTIRQNQSQNQTPAEYDDP